MYDSPINVTLNIESTHGKAVAILQFKNHSNQPIYLDKYNVVLDEKNKKQLFNIYSENNVPVKYTGITIKRKFNKTDFMPLNPGETITTSINLYEWYDFPNKKGEYKIKYEAINHSYEDQQMFEMTSNTVIAKLSPNK